MWLITASTLIAALIPSFQSPDEFDHVTRAYLFTKGQILLSAPPGQASGGYIDTGLARYMDAYANFPFQPDRKLDQKTLNVSNEIVWTGQREFRSAPGMAYYFPAIYLVHGVGLWTGETLGLSVAESYHLTRLCLVVVIGLILLYAFKLVAPSYLIVAFLIMPMTLFQFASASLDGIATALAILLISIFIKSNRDPQNVKIWTLNAALLIWLLLASSRLQTLPMVLLLVALGWKARKYYYLVGVGLALIAVLGWQLLVLNTTVDGRVALGASTQEIIRFYLFNLTELVGVFWRTLSNASVLKGYFSSFFGLLGWLDTPFRGSEYKYLFIAIVVFAASSVGYSKLKDLISARVILIVSAIALLFIVFFSVLVTWTPHPADVVNGVVGRYFLIPALMIGYATSALDDPKRLDIRVCIGWISLWLFGLFSLGITANLLLHRYHLL
jgi:uncharacterized membrane protein